MIGDINNNSNLLPMMDRLRSILSNEKQSNVSDPTIKADLKKTFDDIERYFSHTATLEELKVIQLFKNEFNKSTSSINQLVLSRLEEIIDHSKPNYFAAKITFKDQVLSILDKFINTFVGKIRVAINKQIFFVWDQKLRYASSEKYIQSLKDKITALATEIEKNPSSKTLIEQKEKTEASLKKALVFVAKYEGGLKAAENTRTQLENISGTPLVLETKDKAKLDGFYLDACHFQSKCRDCGGKSINLTLGTSGNISGLIFPKDTKANAFIAELDALKIFKDFDNSDVKGIGWAKVNMGDNIVILPDFEVDKLINEGIITKQIEGLSFKNEIQTNSTYTSIEPKPASGVVVLGLGSAGVYERYKREALLLLMQGTNIMLFNHRGMGESTGKPSESGTYEDMETVYQYLKQVQGVDDEKIVVRGLCLSGGIVAKLAADHPKINVILDQTYTDIRKIALREVLSDIKKWLNYKPEQKSMLKQIILSSLTPILNLALRLVFADYNTIEHMKKSDGHVLVLRTTADEYIDKSMTDEIIDSYAKNHPQEGRAHKMHIGHMSGEHCDSWLDSEHNLGRYHMLSFLKECKVLNPFIDKESTLKALSSEHIAYLNNSP